MRREEWERTDDDAHSTQGRSAESWDDNERLAAATFIIAIVLAAITAVWLLL